MPKPQKRMPDDNRADELLEDLDRLAEMFDKHDLKLQRKVTDTLRQAVEQQKDAEQTDQ